MINDNNAFARSPIGVFRPAGSHHLQTHRDPCSPLHNSDHKSTSKDGLYRRPFVLFFEALSA